MKKSSSLYLCGFIAVMLIQGCAPANYKVNTPTPSQYVYQNTATPADLTLSFEDKRPADEQTFSHGILKAGLLVNNKALDPINYLKEHTALELNARGIITQVAENGGVEVSVNKLLMRNHRSNGYAPFITFTMLSADIKTETGEHRVGVYIKRGKVPVWSFDEIIEPTFNEPLSLLVKEFSAKINMLTANQSASDEQVAVLAAEITAEQADKNVYLKVYQLGFTNNPAAIKPMVEFSKHADEYIRLAAISSLGTLKAEGELEYLKGIYKTGKLWQDRGMALKAICDIGTPAALEFAREVLAEHQKSTNKKDKEAEWTKEIIGLYL